MRLIQRAMIHFFSHQQRIDYKLYIYINEQRHKLENDPSFVDIYKQGILKYYCMLAGSI